MADDALRDEPLALHHYATIVAHKAHFAGEMFPDVLNQLGVPPVLWRAADAFWTERLGASLQEPEAPTAETFSRTFVAVRKKLREDRPEIEQLEPLLEAPAVGKDFRPVEETALAIGTLDEDALPFVAAALAEALPAQHPLDMHHPGAGATQEVSMFKPGVLATLPFNRMTTQAEEPRLRLSMAQYASLHAELAVDPARRAATITRYGLTETDCENVDRAWQARFEGHPEDEARFRELVATYSDWVRGTDGHSGR